jgi:hypothetical protein
VLAPRAVEIRRVAAALARQLEHQVRAPHPVGRRLCWGSDGRTGSFGFFGVGEDAVFLWGSAEFGVCRVRFFFYASTLQLEVTHTNSHVVCILYEEAAHGSKASYVMGTEIN